MLRMKTQAFFHRILSKMGLLNLIIRQKRKKFFHRISIDTKTFTKQLWSNHEKVRLVFRKLDAVNHTKFVNYILKKKEKKSDLTFKETVTLLSEMFRPKTLLSHKRWKYLNLIKKEDEDFTIFTSIVRGVQIGGIKL